MNGILCDKSIARKTKQNICKTEKKLYYMDQKYGPLRRRKCKIFDIGNGFLEMISKNIKDKQNSKPCN
jgi:hypothetical protein